MYNATQIKELDRSTYSSQLVLRLSLADLDLYMLTEERAAATEDHAKGVAIIRSLSEIAYSARLSPYVSGDQVTTLVVEALNTTMPIHSQNASIPTRFLEGKLSDYLSQYCLAGPTSGLYAFRPGQVQLYLSLEGDQIADHFYLFKGILDRFEVIEEGAVVVMTFISDVRWDRIRPYSMNRKNFRLIPQDSIGEGFPIIYGQQAIWHHKDFPKNGTIGDGPCDTNMPLFPVCMNASPTICSARYRQTETNYQFDSEWLITRHMIPPNGLDEALSTNTRALVVPVAANVTAIVRPAFDVGRYGTKFKARYISTDYGSDVGTYDLAYLGVAQIQDRYLGTAQILPLKRIDACQGATDNLASLFGADHRRIGPQNIIDGDRWSWFRDDLATGGERSVVFELGGTYPNLGAVTSIRALVCAQRASGSSTLVVYPWMDYSSTNQVTGSATLTPNADGFAFAAITFNIDPTALALQLQRWEFNQTDVTPVVPMKLRLGWVKSNINDIWNIIHFALLVYFNPARQFLEKFEERVVDRTVEYTKVRGSKDTKVVHDRYLIPVYGDRVPEPMRNVFFIGWGNGSSGQPEAELVWPTAPSTWKTLQNPAYILKDVMLNYGGAYRSDVPGSWPALNALQFEDGGTNHDWSKAAADLNAAVNEANGTTTETFKFQVSLPTWNGVREIVRAVTGSVPGLRVVEYPHQSSAEEGEPYRTSWGCFWPQTGMTATYRRRVDPRTDTISTSWSLTPRDNVTNDIRLRYGHSIQKGTYCRELWYNESVTEHGMPLMTRNSGAQNISAVNDVLATPMNQLVSESYEFYGSQPFSLDLPFVFRWHEALAIRTWLLRWWGFQRCRLSMVVNVHVLDLEIGDTFNLSDDAENYFECQVPLRQFPSPMTGANWPYITWLVEDVTYMPSEMGMVLAKVTAINTERYGGW